MRDALTSELLRGLPEGRAALRLEPPTQPLPRRTPAAEAAPVLAEALVITAINPRAAEVLGFDSASDALGSNGSRWWSFDEAVAAYTRLWEVGTVEVGSPPLRLTLVEDEEGVAACALEVLEPRHDPGPTLERARSGLQALQAHVATVAADGTLCETWGGWDPGLIGHWAAELQPGQDVLAALGAAADAGATGAAAVARLLREILAGQRVSGELDLEWDAGGRPRRVLTRGLRTPWGALLVHTDPTASGGLDTERRLEAVGRLAGGVAHDFNNLLTAISGYCELMLGALPEDSPWRDDLGEIRSAGDRAASLTQQLLAFSCRQVLRPRPLHLPDLLEELRPALARRLGDGVELAIEGTHRLAPVSVDPDQMQQALANLIDNARDAMPDGGRLTVRHAEAGGSAPPGGPFVLLELRDTGTGMSEATQALACEPFFTTRGQAGMGLATVYGIVKQTGGHVTLESREGEGSVVRLFLPQALEGADATPTPSNVRPRPSEGRGETILLVEDERPVRELLKLVLTRNGYAVLEAEDGRAALEVAAGHPEPIDLVVSDVVMPNLDGVELVGRLRAERPGIGVLFVSGYTPASLSETGSPLDPGEAFLGKPFTPRELLTAVGDVLEQRR